MCERPNVVAVGIRSVSAALPIGREEHQQSLEDVAAEAVAPNGNGSVVRENRTSLFSWAVVGNETRVGLEGG